MITSPPLVDQSLLELLRTEFGEDHPLLARINQSIELDVLVCQLVVDALFEKRRLSHPYTARSIALNVLANNMHLLFQQLGNFLRNKGGYDVYAQYCKAEFAAEEAIVALLQRGELHKLASEAASKGVAYRVGRDMGA